MFLLIFLINAIVATTPQLYSFAFLVQFCFFSGASTPCNLILLFEILIVSPSVTTAKPEISLAVIFVSKFNKTIEANINSFIK